MYLFLLSSVSNVCDDRRVHLHGRADEFPEVGSKRWELRLLLRARLGGLPHDAHQRPYVFSAAQAQIDALQQSTSIGYDLRRQNLLCKYVCFNVEIQNIVKT